VLVPTTSLSTPVDVVPCWVEPINPSAPDTGSVAEPQQKQDTSSRKKAAKDMKQSVNRAPGPFKSKILAAVITVFGILVAIVGSPAVLKNLPKVSKELNKLSPPTVKSEHVINFKDLKIENTKNQVYSQTYSTAIGVM
jgi:hypothetical protein